MDEEGKSTLDYVRDDKTPQRRAISSPEAVAGMRNPQ
jgi:hypothetical protein